ncbi:MAG: hypothetical protein ACPGU7_04420 [Gammaproteobacteria bacterium]
MDSTEFIDIVLDEAQGRTALGNMLHGYASNLLSADDCKAFIESWKNLHLSMTATPGYGGPITALQLIPIAPDTRPRIIPSASTDGPDLRLKADKPLRRDHLPSEACTTLSLTTFLSALADSETELKLHQFGEARPTETDFSYSPPRTDENWVEGALREGCSLGQEGGLVWFTETEALHAALARRDGDRVRDRLGLIHRPAGMRQLALSFRHEAVTTVANGRPTALDAGANRCFKSASESTRNQRRKAWGYTADLAKSMDIPDSIDGAPERVCHPIPGDTLGAVRLQVLKPTTQPRTPPGKPFDATFEQRINNGRNGERLRHAVLDLLSMTS